MTGDANRRKRIVLLDATLILAGLFIFIGYILITYFDFGKVGSSGGLTWEVTSSKSDNGSDIEKNDTYSNELVKLDKVVQKKKADELASADKGDVLSGASGPHRQPGRIDVVVNKKNPLLPLQYAPADLVTIYGATISAKAKDDFKAMYEGARAAGHPFSVSSSYRSYGEQVSTYNYWVSVGGRHEADTYSARPGYSEHQTGYVIDVSAGECRLECFSSTPQYKWFRENAATYGFIQRYQAGSESITGYIAEPWHYRYVGRAVAQDMKRKGVLTLEQYWGLAGGDYR